MAKVETKEYVSRRVKLESANMRGTVNSRGLITVSEKSASEWGSKLWSGIEIAAEDVDEMIEYLTAGKSAALKSKNRKK